jgi:hypothetical protein
MSDGFHLERVIAGEFARRLGLPPNSVSFDEGAGATHVLVAANGRQVVLELTKASAPSHAHAHHHGHSHSHAHEESHSVPPRSAGQRLVRAFHDLPAAERPFDVFIRFEPAGCCQTPHLPRSGETQQFLAELKALMRAAQSGERGEFQDVPGRAAPVLFASELGNLQLLSACNAEISFSPASDLRHGGVLETDFDAVSIATADIGAIVAESDKRSRDPDWLVIYEWDVLGVLPELEDLPALPPARFERVFLLNPHSPGYLREWLPSSRRWQDHASLQVV